MWNSPSEAELAIIPNLYESEPLLTDKIVHMKFFIAGSTWYVLEFDGKDIFFGFVILNGDKENAEFGYFSFAELKSSKLSYVEVDRDLYWRKRPIAHVEEIQELLWKKMPAKNV